MHLKTYNKLNFHNSTFCIWKEVAVDEIKDLKNNFKSKSGSIYIFNETGVFRISNHWGRVSNCRWRLLPLTNFKNQYTIVGYAKWLDFFSNDEDLKLFYVAVNFDNNLVDFFHKDSDNYDGLAVLRNANQTAKAIQNIAMILNETSWTKHLQFSDLSILRKEIISELIYSEKSLIEIKRKYL